MDHVGQKFERGTLSNMSTSVCDDFEEPRDDAPTSDAKDIYYFSGIRLYLILVA